MALSAGFAPALLALGTTSDHASVVAITVFVTLLSACIVIGHLLEETRWMNESITALLIVRFCSFHLCALVHLIIIVITLRDVIFSPR